MASRQEARPPEQEGPAMAAASYYAGRISVPERGLPAFAPAVRAELDNATRALAGEPLPAGFFGGLTGLAEERAEQFRRISNGEVQSISGSGMSVHNLRHLEELAPQAAQYGFEISVDMEERKFTIRNTGYVPLHLLSAEERSSLASYLSRASGYLDEADALRAQGRAGEADMYVGAACAVLGIYSNFVETLWRLEDLDSVLAGMESAPKVGGSERAALDFVRTVSGREVPAGELPSEFERLTGVSYGEFLSRGLSAIARHDYEDAAAEARAGLAQMMESLSALSEGREYEAQFAEAMGHVRNAQALAEYGNRIMGNAYRILAARAGAEEMRSLELEGVSWRWRGSLLGERDTIAHLYAQAESRSREAAFFLMARPENEGEAQRNAQLAGEAEDSASGLFRRIEGAVERLQGRASCAMAYGQLMQELDSQSYRGQLRVIDGSGGLEQELNGIISAIDSAVERGEPIENLDVRVRNLEYRRIEMGWERFRFPEVEGANALAELRAERDLLVRDLRRARESGTEVAGLGERQQALNELYSNAMNFEQMLTNLRAGAHAKAEGMLASISAAAGTLRTTVREIPDNITYRTRAAGDMPSREVREDFHGYKEGVERALRAAEGEAAVIRRQLAAADAWYGAALASYLPRQVVANTRSTEMYVRFGYESEARFEPFRSCLAAITNAGISANRSLQRAQETATSLVGRYNDAVEEAQRHARPSIDLADPFGWAVGFGAYRLARIGWAALTAAAETSRAAAIAVTTLRTVPTVASVTQSGIGAYGIATADRIPDVAKNALWIGSFGTGGLIGRLGMAARWVSAGLDTAAIVTTATSAGIMVADAAMREDASVGSIGEQLLWAGLGIAGSALGIYGVLRIPGGMRLVGRAGLARRIVGADELPALGRIAEAQAEDARAAEMLAARVQEIERAGPFRAVIIPPEVVGVQGIMRNHPGMGIVEASAAYVRQARREGRALPAWMRGVPEAAPAMPAPEAAATAPPAYAERAEAVVGAGPPVAEEEFRKGILLLPGMQNREYLIRHFGSALPDEASLGNALAVFGERSGGRGAIFGSFDDVLKRESIGRTAGRAAVNAYYDEAGRIIAFGNVQEIPPGIRERGWQFVFDVDVESGRIVDLFPKEGQALPAPILALRGMQISPGYRAMQDALRATEAMGLPREVTGHMLTTYSLEELINMLNALQARGYVVPRAGTETTATALYEEFIRLAVGSPSNTTREVGGIVFRIDLSGVRIGNMLAGRGLVDRTIGIRMRGIREAVLDVVGRLGAEGIDATSIFTRRSMQSDELMIAVYGPGDAVLRHAEEFRRALERGAPERIAHLLQEEVFGGRSLLETAQESFRRRGRSAIPREATGFKFDMAGFAVTRETRPGFLAEAAREAARSGMAAHGETAMRALGIRETRLLFTPNTSIRTVDPSSAFSGSVMEIALRIPPTTRANLERQLGEFFYRRLDSMVSTGALTVDERNALLRSIEANGGSLPLIDAARYIFRKGTGQVLSDAARTRLLNSLITEEANNVVAEIIDDAVAAYARENRLAIERLSSAPTLQYAIADVTGGAAAMHQERLNAAIYDALAREEISLLPSVRLFDAPPGIAGRDLEMFLATRRIGAMEIRQSTYAAADYVAALLDSGNASMVERLVAHVPAGSRAAFDEIMDTIRTGRGIRNLHDLHEVLQMSDPLLFENFIRVIENPEVMGEILRIMPAENAAELRRLMGLPF